MAPILEKTTYLFFFDHHAKDDGFLSQFKVTPFTDPDSGIEFKTAEHYIHYKMAELFNDQDSCAYIRSCAKPSDAYRRSRMVKDFDGKIWDEKKEEIVRRGNYLKFTIGHIEGDSVSLRDRLLATGNRHLTKASRHDPI